MKNKISDIIRRLEEIQDMYGDINVVVNTQDGGEYEATADHIDEEIRIANDGSKFIVATIS